MDYEFWSEVHARGGLPAVESALKELATRAGPEEVDAAVDVVCRVIEDGTARINALADQHEAKAQELERQVRELEQHVSERSAARSEEQSG
ncbi:hypothetical protein P8605_27730 [Streptomyces sp. T-3]|nr:hypothetical protein [Streptomyces sp. T-3]